MEPIGVAIIGALALVIGGLVTGLFARRKDKADAADKITEAAGKLLEQYRCDNADLRLELTEHQTRLNAMQAEMAQTRNDMTTTRVELAATRGELAATRVELSNTRSELLSTRNELVTTRGELIEMRKGVKMLIRQIEQLGETPAWQPRPVAFPGVASHDGD